MRLMTASRLVRLGMVPVLLFVTLGAAGCSSSFCAGSNCDDGKVYFGSNFKKDGDSYAVVNKSDTFTLGQTVALVAHLSSTAGTKNLTLEVSRGGSTHKFPYGINNTDSNVLASKFTTADLDSLGVTSPGSYTLRFLHGSKELAKGSFTEK